MENKCPICGNVLADDAISCEKCGYKLSGSTRKFKPIEVDANTDSLAPAKRTSECFLRVLRGPMLDTVFPLSPKKISVGRSPNCDICLNDMTVSRAHAQIVPDDHGYTIEDLKSFNGVWVNNKSVSTHHLTQGDIVQLGKFCLVYQEV